MTQPTRTNNRKLIQPLGLTLLVLVGFGAIFYWQLWGPGDNSEQAYTSSPFLPQNANNHIWIEIPAGPFIMGVAEGDNHADRDEFPRHEVTLNTFWIAKHETTNAQYKVFVDDGNRDHIPSCIWNEDGTYKTDLANHPVVCVSWNNALAYTKWLAEESGFEITLPSEAEWEKAARGDKDDRSYVWGNRFDSELAMLLNFCDSNCEQDWAAKDVDDGFKLTAPVGSYPSGASPYGVEDMAGNVWEWTKSKYGPYEYDALDGRETLEGSDPRVLRGGSWFDDSRSVRVSYRNWNAPTLRAGGLGFRVVLRTQPQ